MSQESFTAADPALLRFPLLMVYPESSFFAAGRTGPMAGSPSPDLLPRSNPSSGLPPGMRPDSSPAFSPSDQTPLPVRVPGSHRARMEAGAETQQQRQRRRQGNIQHPGPRDAGQSMQANIFGSPLPSLSVFDEQLIFSQIIRHLQATHPELPPRASSAADRDSVARMKRGKCSAEDVKDDNCCSVCMDAFVLVRASTALPASAEKPCDACDAALRTGL
eukprot:SAG11_NODE_6583_length_1284_cov_1.345148_2_plen_219_part_00